MVPRRRKSTRSLTLSAVLAALSVVLLGVGALLEVLDISMAVIASFAVILAVIEQKGIYPYLIYATTTVLALLLLPVKTPAAMYALFFGYYPILKEKLERLPAVLSWVLKIVIFNAALAVMLVLAALLVLPDFALPEGYAWLWVVVCTPVFVLYDVALTRVLTVYLFKWRQRFRSFWGN